MARGAIWAMVPLGLALCSASAAAQGPTTTQDPAAAQPKLPKPMPALTVPGAGSSENSSQKRPTLIAKRHGIHHDRHARTYIELERPALANVELAEPLPRPPQPPHVDVPVPAYPFENFVVASTAPPPPIVCRITHRDRFKPEMGLLDETPVLCTADNP